jgi:hypothetical protein
MPALQVLVRQGCHLCDDMLEGLRVAQERWDFELRVVDIDGDPALAQRYGAKVPVLMAGDKELCHYFLDMARLQSYFRET